MRATLACLFLSGAVLLSGCFSRDLRIGVAVPLSGPNAKTGRDILNGVMLAAEDWNQKGGVDGRKVVVFPEDDRSTPEQGQAAARRLIEQKVIGVIGHYNSAVSLATADLYEQAQTLMISPGTTAPKLTDSGRKWVFRTIGRDDQQARTAVEYVARNGFRRIVVLDNGGVYGQGIAQEFTRQAGFFKLNILLKETLPPADAQSTLMQRLRNLQPQLIFYGGEHSEAATLARDLKQHGIFAPLMGGDALFDNEFVRLTGKEYAAGALMTFADLDLTPTFRSTYKRKFGEVGPLSGYAYDAATILLEAINQADSTKRDKVRGAVAQTRNFKGVTGTLSFNGKGDVRNPVFEVWQVDANGTLILAPERAPKGGKAGARLALSARIPTPKPKPSASPQTK
jgi:branched-chain amino acid transport system substrate-binding protein